MGNVLQAIKSEQNGGHPETAAAQETAAGASPCPGHSGDWPGPAAAAGGRVRPRPSPHHSFTCQGQQTAPKAEFAGLKGKASACCMDLKFGGVLKQQQLHV